MIGKSWRILREKNFPPENANFAIWFYKQFHWTSNPLVFVKSAGIGKKSPWLGYATNIASVEIVYLALYTIRVFIYVESCRFYTKPGQLGKSSAGASVNFPFWNGGSTVLWRFYGWNMVPSMLPPGPTSSKLVFVITLRIRFGLFQLAPVLKGTSIHQHHLIDAYSRGFQPYEVLALFLFVPYLTPSRLTSSCKSMQTLPQPFRSDWFAGVRRTSWRPIADLIIAQEHTDYLCNNRRHQIGLIDCCCIQLNSG